MHQTIFQKWKYDLAFIFKQYMQAVISKTEELQSAKSIDLSNLSNRTLEWFISVFVVRNWLHLLIYEETSVRNKCRCSFYCALITPHVSAPIGGHLQVVCNTKNSKAVTVYVNGSVTSVRTKANAVVRWVLTIDVPSWRSPFRYNNLVCIRPQAFKIRGPSALKVVTSPSPMVSKVKMDSCC
jgi:hypothetical protein